MTLTGNPIASLKNYRHYVLNAIPTLRVMDFKRISKTEREEAIKMFGGKAGRKLLSEMNNTFTPGAELDTLQHK